MNFHETLLRLRKEAELSQEALADRLHVTRQAVSRWERGETVPEVETLQALSQLFNVSINTLLGSPRTLICQSCGMPMSDEQLARNPDGGFQESYCKWCWGEGDFYTRCTMEEMIQICLPHMPGDPAEARAYLAGLLPTLERWRTAETPA